MSTPSLPADGSYIEMTSSGETLPDVRVVHAEGTVITLSVALTDVPPAGSTVTVRWAAAPRGRYASSADVVAVDGNRVEVRVEGQPAIEQDRNFVRGGGGEPVVLVPASQEAATGFLHDISERSIRAHFSDVEVRPGQEIRLRIQLGEEVVEFRATVTKVSSMRQQIPRRGPLSVELVAVFESKDEQQARVIRRYVMRNQLMARGAIS
jgi:PilZ domain-containing protein